MAEWPISARFGELYLAPPEFFLRSGIDPRAERAGHQLRAETDAERRPSCGEATLEQCELLAEKRVGEFLISADRTAEHDGQIRRQRIDPANIVDAGVAIANRIPVAAQNVVKCPEILKVDVSDCDHRLGHWLETHPAFSVFQSMRFSNTAAAR